MVFDMSLTSRKALKTKTTFQIESFNFYEIQPIIFGTKRIMYLHVFYTVRIVYKLKTKFCKLIEFKVYIFTSVQTVCAGVQS